MSSQNIRVCAFPPVVCRQVPVPYEVCVPERVEVPVPCEQIVRRCVPVPVECVKRVCVPCPYEVTKFVDQPVLLLSYAFFFLCWAVMDTRSGMAPLAQTSGSSGADR